ncbi:MAG: TIGR03915 family putative DNA repair protein [Lachnospiraceae bacterium]|nr:TIGR03915 family putative DNA repair protein [Lachnospiraceae bacterium]
MLLGQGKQNRIYECEDTLEGILSGIYQAWDAVYGHEYIHLTVPSAGGGDMVLFSEYHTVIPDAKQANKVVKTIRKKVSEEVCEILLGALYSKNPDKADAVYHVLPGAFCMGSRVMGNLTDPYVRAVFEMNRNVQHEAHEYLGFLRFEEQEEGILLARFAPKNDLLEIVAPHFEDRFPEENFIIYDTSRKRAAFHQKNHEFFLRGLSEEEDKQFFQVTSKEMDFQKMWKLFVETIAVEDRENKKLQRSLLPYHFRKYMTEMH